MSQRESKPEPVDQEMKPVEQEMKPSEPVENVPEVAQKSVEEVKVPQEV